MPRAKVRDIELYYERVTPEDGAPRLLFIGGSGSDLRQKPNLTSGPLAERFDLLTYDQRGLGQSDIPDGPYTMADYADDAASLLDAVRWEHCSVIGVSFGGMVAQELAVRQPDRIDRLVLCCTSPGGRGGSSYPLHELVDLCAEERANRTLEISDTRMNERWRSDHPNAHARAVALFHSRSKTGAGEPRREIGRRLQLEARREHDVFDRLPGLTMPVLCCGGRYDGIAPSANMEAIRDQIPGARLVLFEGGHLFMMQDRATFPTITGFLVEDRPRLERNDSNTHDKGAYE